MRSFVNSVLVHVAGLWYMRMYRYCCEVGRHLCRYSEKRKINNYLTYPTIMYDHCDVMLLTQVLGLHELEAGYGCFCTLQLLQSIPLC